jgi:hypothetical protein
VKQRTSSGVGLAGITAVAIGVLSLGASLVVGPRSVAVTGQAPDDQATWPQNIPDSGDCGGFGRWVKFTAGGGKGTNKTANSGNPAMSAVYDNLLATPDPGQTIDLRQLRFDNSIVDNFFEGFSTGIASANPTWTFPVTRTSPTLHYAADDKNFSQFALCVSDAIALKVQKVVSGLAGADTTQRTFSFQVECDGRDPDALYDDFSTTFSLQVTGNGSVTSGDVFVPGGQSCRAVETSPGGLVLDSVVNFVNPIAAAQGPGATQTAVFTNVPQPPPSTSSTTTSTTSSTTSTTSSTTSSTTTTTQPTSTTTQPTSTTTQPTTTTTQPTSTTTQPTTTTTQPTTTTTQPTTTRPEVTTTTAPEVTTTVLATTTTTPPQTPSVPTIPAGSIVPGTTTTTVPPTTAVPATTTTAAPVASVAGVTVTAPPVTAQTVTQVAGVQVANEQVAYTGADLSQELALVGCFFVLAGGLLVGLSRRLHTWSSGS